MPIERPDGQNICVVVTRDNHGPLATFLSLMLEKAEGGPYPWVVNLLTCRILQNPGSTSIGTIDNLERIDQRIELHEHVFSLDELDYAGVFIRHCGLQHLEGLDSEFTQLSENYRGIFDRIHNHVLYGGPAVRIDPVYPFVTEVNESLRQRENVSHSDKGGSRIRVGRNDECPCGSTVKFKRCHGR